MMCTLDNGSPPQSLEKTTMSLPESALTARCSTFADILDSPPTADKSTAKQAQRRAKTPTKIPTKGPPGASMPGPPRPPCEIPTSARGGAPHPPRPPHPQPPSPPPP